MEEKLSVNFGKWRPRGALGSELQYAYLTEMLCPDISNIKFSKWVIPHRFWQQLIIDWKNGKSLRSLAREYNTSYEAVRRVLKDNPKIVFKNDF